MGLSIAYHLARLGLSDQVILERHYLAYGASGRNGGGVRQQWSTELHIRLMRESVELCRRFAQELGVNVWFRQGGYLFVARDPRQLGRLERTVAIQQRCGLPTRMLTAEDAREIVPELDVTGVVGGCYNPSDGILFPWPFLWGYARQATRLGARLYTETEVFAIEREAAGGYAVHTNRGTIHARRVVNAAGAWSREIAAMVGVALPTYAVRHEICSSEPLKPFLRPMVSEIGSGLYFSQSMRGEIVGGVSLRDAPTLRMDSRLLFLVTYARRLIRLMPRLGMVKVLRQWAGPYDVSPDGNPIVGASPSAPDFYLVSGFVGHGFMMAPIVGKLYATYLGGGEAHEIFERWRLSRFTEGVSLEQEDLNIG
jgi:sarcosine oxidase subunit beta